MKKYRFGLGLLAVVMTLLVVLALCPIAFGTEAGLPSDASAPQQLLWGLMAVAVPFVTGLLVRKSYAKWLKALLAAVLAVGVGVATVYATGGWSGDAWAIVLACYGVAIATFHGVIEAVPGLKDWLYSHLNADAVEYE